MSALGQKRTFGTALSGPFCAQLATASNPLPAGGSYAEAPQQSVDKAYIRQLQAVAFGYTRRRRTPRCSVLQTKQWPGDAAHLAARDR